MKELRCKHCNKIVARIVNGSKLYKGLVCLCPDCEAISEQMFGVDCADGYIFKDKTKYKTKYEICTKDNTRVGDTIANKYDDSKKGVVKYIDDEEESVCVIKGLLSEKIYPVDLKSYKIKV